MIYKQLQHIKIKIQTNYKGILNKIKKKKKHYKNNVLCVLTLRVHANLSTVQYHVHQVSADQTQYTYNYMITLFLLFQINKNMT